MSLGAALSASAPAFVELKLVLAPLPFSTSTCEELLTVAPVLGLVIGSFIGGLYGTKLGRRNSILIGNTALMIVSVLSLI